MCADRSNIQEFPTERRGTTPYFPTQQKFEELLRLAENSFKQNEQARVMAELLGVVGVIGSLNPRVGAALPELLRTPNLSLLRFPGFESPEVAEDMERAFAFAPLNSLHALKSSLYELSTFLDSPKNFKVLEKYIDKKALEKIKRRVYALLSDVVKLEQRMKASFMLGADTPSDRDVEMLKSLIISAKRIGKELIAPAKRYLMEKSKNLTPIESLLSAAGAKVDPSTLVYASYHNVASLYGFKVSPTLQARYGHEFLREINEIAVGFLPLGGFVLDAAAIGVVQTPAYMWFLNMLFVKGDLRQLSEVALFRFSALSRYANDLGGFFRTFEPENLWQEMSREDGLLGPRTVEEFKGLATNRMRQQGIVPTEPEAQLIDAYHREAVRNNATNLIRALKDEANSSLRAAYEATYYTLRSAGFSDEGAKRLTFLMFLYEGGGGGNLHTYRVALVAPSTYSPVEEYASMSDVVACALHDVGKCAIDPLTNEGKHRLTHGPDGKPTKYLFPFVQQGHVDNSVLLLREIIKNPQKYGFSKQDALLLKEMNWGVVANHHGHTRYLVAPDTSRALDGRRATLPDVLDAVAGPRRGYIRSAMPNAAILRIIAQASAGRFSTPFVANELSFFFTRLSRFLGVDISDRIIKNEVGALLKLIRENAHLKPKDLEAIVEKNMESFRNLSLLVDAYKEWAGRFSLQ